MCLFLELGVCCVQNIRHCGMCQVLLMAVVTSMFFKLAMVEKQRCKLSFGVHQLRQFLVWWQSRDPLRWCLCLTQVNWDQSFLMLHQSILKGYQSLGLLVSLSIRMGKRKSLFMHAAYQFWENTAVVLLTGFPEGVNLHWPWSPISFMFKWNLLLQGSALPWSWRKISHLILPDF